MLCVYFSFSDSGDSSKIMSVMMRRFGVVPVCWYPHTKSHGVNLEYHSKDPRLHGNRKFRNYIYNVSQWTKAGLEVNPESFCVRSMPQVMTYVMLRWHVKTLKYCQCDVVQFQGNLVLNVIPGFVVTYVYDVCYCITGYDAFGTLLSAGRKWNLQVVVYLVKRCATFLLPCYIC